VWSIDIVGLGIVGFGIVGFGIVGFGIVDIGNVDIVGFGIRWLRYQLDGLSKEGSGSAMAILFEQRRVSKTGSLGI